MKKILLSLLLVCWAFVSLGRPVEPDRAVKVAEWFFAPVVDITPAGWTEMYVFAPLEGKGFVVVSADDCTRPVLAYSLDASFNPDSIPQHVLNWFDGYRAEIASLRQAGAFPSVQVQQEWAVGPKTTLPSGVSALMTTTWNQSPRYNWECPYSTTENAYTVTGCTATATAQIMKYWNHPVKGHGSHGYTHKSLGYMSIQFDTAYLWKDMPDELAWNSSQKQIHAVAQLMHHVGVAVEMDYGVNASGAYTQAYGSYNMPSSERALKEHFRYNPLLMAINKEQFTDQVWDSLLRVEIGHGRPVLYSGSDNDGGHAFVLDGYDNKGMFHVNWGWGGWYDGYYTTDSLSPGAGGIGGNPTNTFNKNNAAVIRIFPSYGNDTLAVIDAQCSDTVMGYIDGNGVYDAYQDTLNLFAMAREGYRFDGWANGLTDNPLNYIPNGDFADTALFVPLNKDSLCYSGVNCQGGWRNSFASHSEWGICIPAARRHATRSLSAVRTYVAVPGYYTMSVYYGDSIDEGTLVYQTQADLTEVAGWTTIHIPSAIPLTGAKTLWITFRFASGSSYPAAYSFYTGVPDASWCKTDDGWCRVVDRGRYFTWMIGAVFSPRNYIVELMADSFVGDEHVSGGGEYADGESCTLSSDYDGQPPFLYWDFGNGIHVDDDPYTFVVTQDTTVTAVGTCIGIDGIETGQLNIVVEDRTVSILSPADCEGSLYSATGQHLADGARFTVPSAGVYILRLGQYGSVKVIVP